MLLSVPIFQRAVLSPAVSNCCASPCRKAEVYDGWLLCLLLCFSGRLWAQQYVYQRQLGSQALLVQFHNPRAVAVDGNGNLYVAERGSSVVKLDSSGHFRLQFGKQGSGEGQLNQPQGVAVDGSGNLYVADLVNNRIAKFDSTGRFLLQFGSLGGGEGQFQSPSGLAVDGHGNLYVADTYNCRVQKFDSEGRFLSQFGSYGGGQGQLNQPQGVAVDNRGRLYVADQYNHRIQQFDSLGRFLGQFGSRGSGEGQFNYPTGVAIDGSGNLYVADQGNHRIQQLDSSGGFLSRFGSEGSGVALDDRGQVYELDTYNHRIQQFSSTGRLLSQFGSESSGQGQFSDPIGVAVDGRGQVYVLDQGNHRIQRLDSTGRFLSQFGSQDSGEGLFNHPTGVALDGSRNIHVAEASSIRKFDSTGLVLFQLDFGYYQLSGGVAVDGSGHVYGAYSFEDRGSSYSVIPQLDSSGRFLNEFVYHTSYFEGHLNQPQGVAVDGSGHLYVVDYDSSRIQKFDLSGRFLLQFGSGGGGLAVDGHGQVYVLDNYRIQVFDSEGRFLSQVGRYGYGEGQFLYPVSVAVDGSGNLYVAETNERAYIQKFSAGRYLPYGFQTGAYALSATPYSQPDGKGVKGLGLRVNFQVVNSASTARTSVGEELASMEVAVYPKPFAEQVILLLRSSVSQPVVVQAYDAKGGQIGSLYQGELEAGKAHRVEVDGRSWAEGLYLLRVTTPQGQLVKKVMRQRY